MDVWPDHLILPFGHVKQSHLVGIRIKEEIVRNSQFLLILDMIIVVIISLAPFGNIFQHQGEDQPAGVAY
jgi:hypothetical protein